MSAETTTACRRPVIRVRDVDEEPYSRNFILETCLKTMYPSGLKLIQGRTIHKGYVEEKLESGELLSLAFQRDSCFFFLELIRQHTPRHNQHLCIRGPTSLKARQLATLQQLAPLLHHIQWHTHTVQGLGLLLQIFQATSGTTTSSGNTSLQSLPQLELSFVQTDGLHSSFGTFLHDLLSLDRFSRLKIDTNQTIDMTKICAALRRTRHLWQLELEPALSTQHDLQSLLLILELPETPQFSNPHLQPTINTTLKSVSMDPSLRKFALYKKVQHYLHLNQYGRHAIHHNPHLSGRQLVNLLTQVPTGPQQHRLQYDMLRQAPSFLEGRLTTNGFKWQLTKQTATCDFS